MASSETMVISRMRRRARGPGSSNSTRFGSLMARSSPYRHPAFDPAADATGQQRNHHINGRYRREDGQPTGVAIVQILADRGCVLDPDHRCERGPDKGADPDIDQRLHHGPQGLREDDETHRLAE